MAKEPQVKPNRADAKRPATTALADIDKARQTVERLSIRLQCPVEAPSNTATDLAAWRVARRSGAPVKLGADSELRAFVLDRIATLTYDQIVQALPTPSRPAVAPRDPLSAAGGGGRTGLGQGLQSAVIR